MYNVAVLENVMPDELYDLFIEERLTSYLIIMKLCPNIKGFKFILHGVKLLVHDISKKRNINNILYDQIANELNTDKTTIDGALRHAIELSSKRNGFKNFVKDFDFLIKGERPTPRELLSALAIKIKKEKFF